MNAPEQRIPWRVGFSIIVSNMILSFSFRSNIFRKNWFVDVWVFDINSRTRKSMPFLVSIAKFWKSNLGEFSLMITSRSYVLNLTATYEIYDPEASSSVDYEQKKKF